MKIEQEYLKGLLEAFEEANSLTTHIGALEKKGFSYQEDKFIFHLRILADQRLVESENGTGLGFSIGAGGDISWSVVSLRLTASGHEFVEALRNSKVWKTIKSIRF